MSHMTLPVLIEDLATLSSAPLTRNHQKNLHLPRILCLHGGGTNARIFRTQCRTLRAHLLPYFRLVFADAPFPSQPGPDVESVFAEWGPFRSWLPPKSRSSPNFSRVDVNQAVVESIDRCIAKTIQEDDSAGATGAWVGLLGFSQGAKMAASLLMRQQNQNHLRGSINATKANRGQQRQTWKPEYRFAVLLAGRAPLVSMEPDVRASGFAAMADPSLLQLPTIHVHGLQDAGISMHRDLLHQCCEKGSTRVVEWDGSHRVPIKTKDGAAVVAEILDVARESGVLG